MKNLLFAIAVLFAACSKSDSPAQPETVKPSIEVLNTERFATKTRFDVRVSRPELVKTIHFYYGTSVDVAPKSGSFFVNQVGPMPGKFTIWAKDGSKIEMGGTW
jgi:hypothetical protein